MPPNIYRAMSRQRAVGATRAASPEAARADANGGSTSAQQQHSFTRARECSVRAGLASVAGAAKARAKSVNKAAQETAGKAASMHGGVSSDVLVGHTLRSQVAQLIPRLLWAHPLLVIQCGLLMYLVALLFFALLFYLLGPSCFKLSPDSDGFSFLEMTWLSVHTISTVGFGSSYPTCVSSQLVVAFESYFSVLLQSVISAYVVFTLIRSRARIRFSKSCLVTIADTVADPESAEPQIEVNFRLVRESHSAVRDARIYVQARYSLPPQQSMQQGASPTRSGPSRRRSVALASKASDGSDNEQALPDLRAELELHPNQMSSLDLWHVSHVVDEESPLCAPHRAVPLGLAGACKGALALFASTFGSHVGWTIRHQLKKHLRSVDVSLSAYDTAFQQEVKLYVHYKKEEIVHHARFEPLNSSNDAGRTTTVDLSKLDMLAIEKRRPGSRFPPSLIRQKTTQLLTGGKRATRISNGTFSRRASRDVSDGALEEGSVKRGINFRLPRPEAITELFQKASSSQSSQGGSGTENGTEATPEASFKKGVKARGAAGTRSVAECAAV